MCSSTSPASTRPLPRFVARLKGATTFSQDIMYPDGVIGNRIGGSACALPVPDGFASKACLTCSLQHFEGDGDTRLFVELARVLRPGGAVCIVPFYVNTEAVTQTDPVVSVGVNVHFESVCRSTVPRVGGTATAVSTARSRSPDESRNRCATGSDSTFSI